MAQEQFSFSQAERWTEISDFSGYSVSDHGRVKNLAKDVCLKISINTKGLAMVGLMQRGIQKKRSVPLLVASTYLRPHPNPEFDTPINLDGDKMNNHYENLEWRPLWFARRYTRQFIDGHPTYDGPIEDVETHVQYESSMHAATAHGVLDIEVYMSMEQQAGYVWPTNQIFRKALVR